MSVTFAVKAHTFSLYRAIKEEAEKLGWVYYEDFMDFEEESMKRNNCLYFCNEWPDYNNELLFSFSNPLDEDKIYHLPGDWNSVIDHLKELNPAKGAVTHTMTTDPNLKPDELKNEAEQATEQAACITNAPATEAAVADAEEGSTEG